MYYECTDNQLDSLPVTFTNEYHKQIRSFGILNNRNLGRIPKSKVKLVKVGFLSLTCTRLSSGYFAFPWPLLCVNTENSSQNTLVILDKGPALLASFEHNHFSKDLVCKYMLRSWHKFGEIHNTPIISSAHDIQEL